MRVKYAPYRDMVLVRKIEKKESAGGIILPDSAGSRFIELEVMGKGEEVEEDFNPGDIVLAEAMVEVIDKTDEAIGLIRSKYIVCQKLI